MSTEKLEKFYQDLKDLAGAQIADKKLSRDRQAINRVINEIKEQSTCSTIDFSESLKILNLQLEGIKLPEKQSMLLEQQEQPYHLSELTKQYMEAITESRKKDILMSIYCEHPSRAKMVLSSLEKNVNLQLLNEEETENGLSIYVTLTSPDLLTLSDKIQEYMKIVNFDVYHFLPDFKERTLEDKKRLINENIELYDRNLRLQAAELGYCSTNALYYPVDGIKFIEKSIQQFYNGTCNIYENKKADNLKYLYAYDEDEEKIVNPFSDIDRKNKKEEKPFKNRQKNTL